MMNHRIHILLRYGTQITQIKRILTVLFILKFKKIIRVHQSYPCHLCAIATVIAALSSCDVDGPLGECPYNARLEYWYTGSGTANVLPDYIHRIHEFVYDANDRLVQVSELTDARRILYGELLLTPGKYRLVAWANVDSVSRVNRMEIGSSHPGDMILYPVNPYVPSYAPGALRSNTERLYFGTDTFSVKQYGVTRQRIDMVHCHLKLNITVKWRGTAPSDTKNFNMRLRSESSSFRFTVAEEVNTSASVQTRFQPFIYHIPEVVKKEVAHRIDIPMGISRSLQGEFVTYRLTNDMHPVFCTYAGDTPLMKEIDLMKYFRTMQIDLDRSLKQEYSLIIEIMDDGTVLVTSVVVSDWEDGGVINGIVK